MTTSVDAAAVVDQLCVQIADLSRQLAIANVRLAQHDADAESAADANSGEGSQ